MIYYSKNDADIKSINDYLNNHGIYVDSPKEINNLWIEFSEENDSQWLYVDYSNLELFFNFVRFGKELEML